MRFYLDNTPLRERIAAQGMQHVRAHHSYDCMVDSLLAAYADIQVRRPAVRAGP
jgi:spore maturation protein CgeB